MNYYQSAQSDAKEMALEFIDATVEQLIEKGAASTDLYNDYDNGDRYHHEVHVDRFYSLLEAATLLDQLNEYEETDSGLWAEQMPTEAISTQAAFTYGNAVYSLWVDIIEYINREFDADDYEILADSVREWIGDA